MGNESDVQQLIDAGILEAPASETPATEETAAEVSSPVDSESAGAVNPVSVDDQPLGDAGLKALRAEREARAKFEAEVKQRSSELTSTKSQLTKATKELEALKAERDASAREAARLRVAVAHGLSQEDLEVLPVGVDEEVLEKLAARLATSGPRKPAPDAGQGRDGAAPLTPKDEFAAFISNF